MLFMSSVSQFIFWLVLFITESELLKSPTIIIWLSTFSIMSVFTSGILGFCCQVQIEPFIIIKYLPLSLVTFFFLKVYLFDVSISTSPVCLQFAWYIFVQPFNFKLFVSLIQRLSLVDPAHGSWIFIHSVKLCLFIVMFNSFMYNGITDNV